MLKYTISGEGDLPQGGSTVVSSGDEIWESLSAAPCDKSLAQLFISLVVSKENFLMAPVHSWNESAFQFFLHRHQNILVHHWMNRMSKTTSRSWVSHILVMIQCQEQKGQPVSFIAELWLNHVHHLVCQNRFLYSVSKEMIPGPDLLLNISFGQ